MRILAIRGANLASLAREFEVDLAAPPLCGAGLFAITGRVGAGKTTLLDAVCLALFDRTPRLSGRGGAPVGDSSEDQKDWLASNDVRTVLRRGAAEGYAEVDFVGVDGRAYRARWSVHRARRRVEGRLQAQEMALRELGSGRSIGGRKTEVLQAIRQRLGLDFDQFCRSVLLAQGDFAAFLKARPAERAELLERMTGTSIYRQLSKAAFARHRNEQEALRRLQDNAATLQPLAEEPRRRLETALARAEQRQAELQQQELAAQRAWSWYETAERQRQQEAEALQVLQRARQAQDQAEERRRELQRVQEVQALRPCHEAWQQAESEWRQVQDRLRDALRSRRQVRREAARAAEVLQRQQAELREGDPPEAVAAWLAEHRFGIPLVRDFARDRPVLERYRALRHELAALQAKRREIEPAVAAGEDAVRQAELVLEAARRRQQLALQARQQARARVAANPEPDLQRRRDAAGRRGRWLAELQPLAQEYRLHGERLQRIEAQRQRHSRLLADAAAAIASEERARREAERELAAARQEVEAALSARDLDAHRRALRPGQPCPLCGATEHPRAATDPAPVCEAADQRLSAAEGAHAACLDRLGALRQEHLGLQQRLEELAAEHRVEQEARDELLARWRTATAGSSEWPALLDGDAAERLRLALQEHRVELDRLQELEAQWTALRSALDAAEEELAAAVDAAQRAAEDRAAAEIGRRQAGAAQRDLDTRQRAAEAALRELSAALEQALAYPGWQRQAERDPDRFASLCAAIAGAAAELARLRELCRQASGACRAALSTARQSRQRRDRLQRQWREKSAGLGQSDEELARALQRDRAWIERRRSELEALSVEVERARAVLRERQERRREHESRDRPDLGAEEARRRLEEAGRRRQEANQAAAKLRAELEHDDWVRRMLAELSPKLQEQRERAALWAAMHELIGSAGGDKFQVFAQSLTMDLLVEQANLRLRELARRYRLRRVPGEDMDLVVVDLDMGESVRSIHTLSGGESFLVALALALALASLSAHGSRLETLFIDEGFGSLDHESLETALSALDALQATGCQVGVISHVEGLAERIGVRVEVRSDGRGASVLQVC